MFVDNNDPPQEAAPIIPSDPITPAVEVSAEVPVEEIPTAPEESTGPKVVVSRHPIAHQQWQGENFNIGVTYSDYFRKEVEVNRIGDMIDEDKNEFTYLVSHIPSLMTEATFKKSEALALNTEKGQLWGQVVREGAKSMDHAPTALGLQGFNRMTREGSEYEHALTTEQGSRIGLSIPKLAESDAPVLTGSAALFRMQSLLGRGPTIQIPLVHSGFWITLRAPTNQTLINLYELINQDKITLGRGTHGFIYSAHSAYTTRIIMQVIQEHIHDTTLKIGPEQNIMDLIKVPDLDLVLLGWARVIWPNGYSLVRSIITPDGAATGKMVRGNVDLAKMLWLDNKYLNAWQKAHMAQRASRVVPIEAVERYVKETPVWQGRSATIKSGANEDGSDSVKLQLGVPSITQYLVSSQRWIDGVVELVESTLTIEGQEEMKNSKIHEHSRANIARQYSHWIQKITLGNQEVVDPETLDELIDVLSSENSFNDNFYKEVSDYRDDIGIAVVGIPEPNFKEVSPNKRFSRIIPVDPLTHFFNLLAARSLKIVPR